MAILDFCTGISQIVQNESTSTSETTTSDYLLETVTVYGTSTGESNRTWNLNSALPSEFWLSCCIDGISGSFYGYELISLHAGDTKVMYIIANSSEQFEFYVYNGTDYTLAGTSDSDFSSFTLARFDFNVDATNGTIDFYIDRSLSHSMSSLDLSYLDGVIDNIVFSYINSGTSSSNATKWCGCFVADEDTTVLTMVQSQVTGDGDYQQLSGSYEDVECIGKTGDNSSIMSTSSGQKSSFTLEDRSGDISTGTIAAVGVYCRINQDASLGDQARMFLTDGSGNETYTDYVTVDQYITPHRFIVDTDPNGGGDFDLTSVYDYEVGIEVSQS